MQVELGRPLWKRLEMVGVLEILRADVTGGGGRPSIRGRDRPALETKGVIGLKWIPNKSR
jgi:hypothetical protein